ncbi:hypothetical protein RND81_06G200300 [Saponaria officinalis]|uniref:RING-type domain-containing protein n=1 Tax=Saponaria officinalis TaxID=3572 RepID=A0AAW1KCU2_SAPOF
MKSGSTPGTSSHTFGNDYEFHRKNEPPIGTFTYGLIGMSLGVFVFIIIITVTSYFCLRDSGPSLAGGRPQGQQPGTGHVISNIVGIDEETLKSYPKCLYSELEKSKKEENGGNKGPSTQNSCTVCLGEYKGSEMVRELGECGHVFHVECVDSWLRLNPTCPLCRTSPFPTPQLTPLAHVVPLARSLRGG